MLDHAGLAALDFVYAVIVISGAGIDILGLIYRGRQIRLGGLLGEIRARDLNLQTRLVRCCCYNVKVLGIHCFYSIHHLADSSR